MGEPRILSMFEDFNIFETTDAHCTGGGLVGSIQLDAPFLAQLHILRVLGLAGVS